VKTKRRLSRKARKPLSTHHKLIIGLSILLFAILLQVGLVKNFFTPAGAVAITDSPVTKKVFLLIFNPTIDQDGVPVKLTNYLSWQNPDTISESLVPVFPTVSQGFLSYSISERQEVNGWPTKVDGFVYNQASYLQCWQDHSTCHAQDAADFQKMFSDYGICSKNVDEVWVWGGPWFGYPEHQVVNFCGKSQFVMGFNYERNFDEALHNFGHRMEFVTSDSGNRINNGVPWKQDSATEWNKFSKIDTGCGNIHYPPSPYDYTFVNPDGSLGKPLHEEYDYSNTTPVTSACEGYLNYPAGPFPSQTITCEVWGCTQGGYVQWWLSHIPAKSGVSIDPQTGRTLYNNWWKYYAYFDETAVPPSIPGDFSNVSAIFGTTSATFAFNYSGSTSEYLVDVSTVPDMSTDVYVNFATGSTSPLIVSSPQAKWDKYSCGRTLYWRVYSADRSTQGPIITTVACPVPTATPTPIKKADLVITSYALTNSSGTVKSSFKVNEAIYVKVTYKNNGNAASATPNGTIYSTFYKNKPTSVPNNLGSDPINFYSATPNLAAGESKTYASYPRSSTVASFPGIKTWKIGTVGTYTARVFQDYDVRVSESNENNNQAVVQYTITK